jgi:hypothetical protein
VKAGPSAAAEEIGNDLVWLGDPANVGRFADKRLLHRILTAAERLLVAVSPEPDVMLWSLWAAKEAEYKAWSRSRKGLFSPVSFVVEFSPGLRSARVVKGEWSLPVRWTRGPDWVHALAAADAGPVTVKVESAEGDPSEAVRALAVRAWSDAGGPSAKVEGRPPRLVWPGGGHDVSLSHDGPYAAVAFRAP